MGRIDVYNATDAPITTDEGVIEGRSRGTVDESAAGIKGLVDVTPSKSSKKTEPEPRTASTKSSSTRKSAAKGADDSQED